MVSEITEEGQRFAKFRCPLDGFRQYCRIHVNDFPIPPKGKMLMVRTFAALFVGLIFLSSVFAQDDSNASKSAVAVETTPPAVSLGTPEERLADILSGEAAPSTIEDLQAMQVHISELAERVKRATVGIDCEGAQGSGVIVSKDGLVLTAAHVIGEPGLDALIRLPNGNIVKAKTKGLVHLLDSGLMKITDPGDYDYLDMGESGSLKLGQWVMAVGHPGGYEAARGMVVRVGRVLSLTSRVVRSDCTLVGGDSGGPLVDMDGNVVGIHSRIGARLSDNMHVPIDVFASGWDELEADKEIGGRPGRPTLGITLKGDNGLEIEEVQPEGPAERAGIEPGDVIVEIEGKLIQTREQLAERLNDLEIGTEVDVKVMRGADELELKLVIGRR